MAKIKTFTRDRIITVYNAYEHFWAWYGGGIGGEGLKSFEPFWPIETEMILRKSWLSSGHLRGG